MIFSSSSSRSPSDSIKVPEFILYQLWSTNSFLLRSEFLPNDTQIFVPLLITWYKICQIEISTPTAYQRNKVRVSQPTFHLSITSLSFLSCFYFCAFPPIFSGFNWHVFVIHTSSIIQYPSNIVFLSVMLHWKHDISVYTNDLWKASDIYWRIPPSSSELHQFVYPIFSFYLLQTLSSTSTSSQYFITDRSSIIMIYCPLSHRYSTFLLTIEPFFYSYGTINTFRLLCHQSSLTCQQPRSIWVKSDSTENYQHRERLKTCKSLSPLRTWTIFGWSSAV